MSARGIALRVLTDVEWGGARAAAALAQALAKDPTVTPEDRALATELVYGVLRHQGRLDHALAHHVRGGARGLRKAHPAIRRILRIGAYQILELDRIPHRAAVAEAVEAAKSSPVRRGAGFVNAVLRSLARSGPPELPDPAADPRGHLVHALSLPPWLADRFLAWFGPDRAVALAAALAARPPVTLRANTARCSREALRKRLAEGDPPVQTEPTRYSPAGLRVVSGADLHGHPAYAQGAFVLQDEASQLVAPLLSPRPRAQLLDACAGRGGKSLHLLDLTDPPPRLLSMDRNRGALRDLGRRAARLGLTPPPALQADLLAPLPFAPELRFDGVLLDAPCSGLGVLRRNPEIKWRLTPADLADLAARQRALLTAAAARVRPGGVLLYAVCTVNPEEGPAQVATFLAERADFAAEPPPPTDPGGEGMPGAPDFAPLRAPDAAGLPPGVAVAPSPDRHDTDGFFMVRLRRIR